MPIGGFANRVARVDLAAGTVGYEEIPEEWARKYIGARGLGVRYVLENGAGVDPLGPDNLLCFMNGPLTGTEANMSGRMAVVTKSPLTGTVTDSHQGGWSAARIRWAGFDGLLFEGAASTPVYAYVENGTVELHDASEVWGKGAHATVKHFQDKYGADNLSVITIGQAGENRVKYAAWINENDRSAGRGGTGAVGGSKNLKAIVVKAGRAVPKASDTGAWSDTRKKALATIMDEKNVTAPRKGGLSVYGTNVLMNITSAMGALPAKNSQLTSFGDRAEKISGEFINDNYLVANPTCHACPVACKKEVEIKDGPYKGLRMESFEYESAWALGANCDMDDAPTIAKLIDLCNDYGMDTIELGNVFSTYMEACDLGYVDGGDKIDWGDGATMVTLTTQIAQREGVGDVLAEGTAGVAKHYGHPEIAMAVKGQAIPAYDPRGLKGMGIAYATSNRGACHLRAYTPASELGLIEPKTDPLEWKGKGELTKILQDVLAFSDSLDLCKFSAFAEGPDEYAAQYAAITGLPFTSADLLRTGERIYNLERLFNNLAGHGEGSDTLPDRFTKEASTMPGSLGHVCELDQMLAEYYAARGWQNGVVPDSKLAELDIEYRPTVTA
jgi:aldehyde:ferredoxin oxidoreductase